MSVAEARKNLRSLLDEVASGSEVVVLRRGKEIARIVPPRHGARRLPSLARFRKTIKLKGEPLSATVIRMRREERF